jgi:mannose-1-phosphate guanylyltransferase
MQSTYAIIMSGGRGKRFWPLSQVALPKQFLHFAGDGSLFLQTFENLRRLMPPSHIIIVEPIQNNTGPCIALGLSHVLHQEPDATIVILPADHYVENKEKFSQALGCALNYAGDHHEIVTFGIAPETPHTGYGYLQLGKIIRKQDGFEIRRGKRFIEKPNLETAVELLKDSDYRWNSGIFCARGTVLDDAFRKHLPDIYRHIHDFRPHIGTPGEADKLLEVYKRMPRISIDYGIMEHIEQLAIIPIDVGWNDVGTWSSLRRLHPLDNDENLVLGDHHLLDTKASTVISDVKVVAIGMENVIIAANGNYVLVCARDKEHCIQDVVDHLEENE